LYLHLIYKIYVNVNWANIAEIVSDWS